jgi:hypothetical protein
MLPSRARLSASSCFVALLLPTALAQERVATAGRVLDAGGRPVANATVHFAGSEPPLRDRLEPADAVTATTNDKGRFQVALRERAEYEGFAIAPPAADGTHACSAVLAVRPGTGFEIVLSATTRSRQLTVAGLDAWREHAALRLEMAMALAHGHAVPLEVRDGRAELPLVPPGTAWHLFVRDDAGALWWSERIDPAATPATFTMPPPRTIPVRVVDAAGAPVAGADIRAYAAQPWRAGHHALTPPPPLVEWRIVGRTDATGTAAVVVPCRDDPFADPRATAPLLLAGKPGHAGALGGWCGQRIGEDALAARSSERLVTFTLAPRAAFAGRLLGTDGKPIADRAVALSGRCSMPLPKGAVLRMPAMFTARTAADGTFAFGSLPPLEAPVLHVPSTEPKRRPPALFVPDLAQPFVLDASRLATIDLVVRGVDGEPARGADVVLLPSPIGDHELDASTWRGRLDNRGTAQLQLQPGTWSLAGADRSGFALTTVDCAGAKPLELSLAALPVLRGAIALVVDDRPEHAQLFVNGISHGSAAPPEPTATLRALGAAFNPWYAACTVVAADGSFELPFLDVPGTRYSGGIRIGQRFTELRLVETSQPKAFVLRER